MRARRSWLLYAASIAVVIALGFWLFAPALQLRLFSDDYMAEAMRVGRYGVPRAPLDIFNFIDGSEGDVRALQRTGIVAWWAPSDLRISFMRPLSSALVHIDHALFGDALWAYHLHSLFAWALLAIVASAFYWRLLPMLPAALATAFFALDQSQHGPAVWLCNRGALYAMLFCVVGLHQHRRYREDGKRLAALWSLLAFSVALLFGEYAIPMLGYVFAFELVKGRGALVSRGLALWPAAVPAALFLVLRALLGYGARGSGVYVDPASDPAGFGLLLLHRVPVLVADMLFNLPAQQWDQGSPWRERILDAELIPPWLWLKMPPFRFFHVAIGVLALILLALLVRFALRRSTPDERKSMLALLLGALLALLPVVGAFPSTRLTLAAMFGMAPVFAFVLRAIGSALSEAPSIGLPRFLALFALGALVLKLQFVDPMRENVQGMVDGFTGTTEWVLGAELDPKRVAGQRVIVLNALEFTTTFFFVPAWIYFGRPEPRAFLPISTAPFAHDVERVADNQLRMRALGGSFLGAPSEVHFRPLDRPLREGETVALDGVRVTAERLRQHRPQSLLLTFERSVDDPSYVFLTATNQGLKRVVPPALGAITRLPRGAPPNWTALERGRYEQRIGPFPEALRYSPVPAFVAFEP